MDARLTIRVLGPVEILRARRPVPLGGPRLRALLAYLVVHHGRVVPTERIITDLWGADAGDGARRSLHTQISSLRKRLSTPDGTVTIQHDAAGYRLDAPGTTIDLHEFERLSETAVTERDAQAAAQALELWRDDPLSEVADEPWAQATITGLRERWMQVLLIDLDAQLDDGQHRELVPRLEALVGEHPFVESLWERLLVALYRSGRQTHALDAYHRLEEILREELGLEPGPELQRLQRRVLLHDPGLLPPSSAPHEVHQVLASFVGRDAELNWLDSLVDEHRLITVLGPGGVGKTRVAIELAHRQRGRRPAGIWFVDLAPVREVNRVAEVLAHHIGVDAGPGQELASVSERVGAAEALVVLDNCEHLRAETARIVTDLLATTPTLRVVVTSRVALGIPGEVNWVLPPLELPDAGEDHVASARRDAVRLFVDRATAVRPAFRLGETNAATVARLCRRLDGLPLALELAASRLRSIGISEILSHLETDLDVLRSPDPNVDERHRTLSTVLSWSSDLLHDDTRVVHARLSVLAGSFDAALAAAVMGTNESEVVDHLDALVANSLLSADTTQERTRYRMLEVVRDHAATLLDGTGDRRAAELGLLAWAMQVTERPAIEPDSTEEAQGLHVLPTTWVRRIAADEHNLRAALAAGEHDPDTGLALATRLTRYWWSNAGSLDPNSRTTLPAVREGIDWLERLLALPGTDARRRDVAAVALGFLRTISGDRQRALADLLAVRDRLHRRGQHRTAGWASMYAGTASLGLLPASDAAQLYHDARKRFEEAGEFQGQLLLTGLEFGHAMAVGDIGSATAVIDRFLDTTEAAASPSVATYRDLLLAWQALLDGDDAAAAERLRAVHEQPPRMSDPVTTVIVLGTDAWWATLAGYPETAAELLAVCDTIEARSGLDLHFTRALRDQAARTLSRIEAGPPEQPPPRDVTETTMLEAFEAVRAHLESG